VYERIIYILHGVEFIVDCPALKVEHDVIIIKNLSIASNNIIPAKYFMILNAMIHNIGENNA
jgi:hypothetical protein